MLKKKKEETFSSLAEAVSVYREKMNITQRELSRRTGIDNNTIAKIEKGERKKPNILSLKKIGFALNINPDYLMKLSGYNDYEIKMSNTTLGANMSMPREDGTFLLVEEALIYDDQRYKVYPFLLDYLKSGNILKNKNVKKYSDEELEKLNTGIEKVSKDLKEKIENYELAKESIDGNK